MTATGNEPAGAAAGGGGPETSPPHSRPTIRRRPRTLLLVLAALSLLYGAAGTFLEDAARQGQFFWDLDYYRTVADRWNAGLDPFLADGEPTGYYYSLTVTPAIAWAFRDFRAERLYALLTALGILATLALSIRAVSPPHGAALSCWLYALAFGTGEVAYVLASGNLSWLVALLQAGALLAAAQGGWVIFYTLVGLASLVKPYALLLLVVPLALRRLSPLATIALVPLLVDATLGLLLWPELAGSRSAAIWAGVIEPLQLRYSLCGRLSRALHKTTGLAAGPATALGVAVQLGVATAFVAHLRARPPVERGRLFALAVVAAFTAVPRMAGYDAFLYGPAVFVAFFPRYRLRGSWAAIAAGWLAPFAGLFKEGLAVLQLVAGTAARARPDRGALDDRG